MKHYLIKLLTNTKGQDGSSIAVYNDIEGKSSLVRAKVAYHQTLATLNNEPDVLLATVKIIDEFGNDVHGLIETVDNRPAPSPEEVVDVTNE